MNPKKVNTLIGNLLDDKLMKVSLSEELSEEDQNLKNELEMLVARLHVCEKGSGFRNAYLQTLLNRNQTAPCIYLHSTP